MGPIGRIKRCAVLLERRLDETFAEFGLSRWEFDRLAPLRRSGAYTLPSRSWIMKRQTRVPASTVVRMNRASNRMAK